MRRANVAGQASLGDLRYPGSYGSFLESLIVRIEWTEGRRLFNGAHCVLLDNQGELSLSMHSDWLTDSPVSKFSKCVACCM